MGTTHRERLEGSVDGAASAVPERRRRRRIDVVLAVGGMVVLVATAAIARGGGYGWEGALFHAINGLPDGLSRGFWLLNQYGTAITIPAVTIVALVFRRWVTALSLAVSGVVVYTLARVIKEYVDRGRPGALLSSVVERETFSPESLGYPSGHAAVAWAITIVVLAHLGRRWGIVAITLASTVLLSRMYVGAHVPLDLIGGAALGVMVGSVSNLAFGVLYRTPVRRPRRSVVPMPVGVP